MLLNHTLFPSIGLLLMISEPSSIMIMVVSFLKDLPVHESGLPWARYIITAWTGAVAIGLFTVWLLAWRALRWKWWGIIGHVALMVGTAVPHWLLNARNDLVFKVVSLLVLFLVWALLFRRFLMAGELSVHDINIVLLYLRIVSVYIRGTMLRYVWILKHLLLLLLLLWLTIKELLLLLLEQVEVRV